MYEWGTFIVQEAANILEAEIEGLKPMVAVRGTPTQALYVDFDSVGGQPDASSIALALRPAVHALATAIKRGHIKRFYPGELPNGCEIAKRIVTKQIALTFTRFFHVQKRQMVNRLHVLGAVRH